MPGSPPAASSGRDAPGRRARARAHGVPRGRVLGSRGRLRSGDRSRRGSSPSRASASRTAATSAPTGSCAARRASSTRRRRAGSPTGSGLVLPGRPRRGEAVRPPSEPAVHDLDAAAGGAPQAPLLRADDDAASRSASTRTATSPTCAPTRRRCRSRRSLPRASRPTSSSARTTFPPKPRRYERKVKNAQEAHEAIRPAGDRFRTPQEVRAELSRGRARALRADLDAHRRVADGGRAGPDRLAADRGRLERRRGRRVRRLGTVITFRGFLAAYEEGRDDDARRRTTTRSAACRTSRRATGRAARVEPKGHETNPPARYTEARLVRTLEELGIGRPSTYASILGTILDRGYVFKRGTALVPAFLAFSVVDCSSSTSAGSSTTTSRRDGGRPRPDRDRRRAAGRVARASTSATDGAAAAAGQRPPRAGLGPRRDRRSRDQLARDRRRDRPPRRPLRAVSRARRAAREHPRGARPRRADGRAGRGAPRAAQRRARLGPIRDRPPIVARTGRYGPYVTEVLPEDAKEKPPPRRCSRRCRSTRSRSTTRFACSCCRAARRRRGRRGDHRAERPLRAVRQEGEGIALARVRGAALHDRPRGALALLAQPRQRRGRGARDEAARELGTDPVGGKEIVLKEGRFGPYVTDGETNASLRKGDDPETVTLDRAVSCSPSAARRARRRDAAVAARLLKVLHKLRRPVRVLSSRTGRARNTLAAPRSSDRGRGRGGSSRPRVVTAGLPS